MRVIGWKSGMTAALICLFVGHAHAQERTVPEELSGGAAVNLSQISQVKDMMPAPAEPADAGTEPTGLRADPFALDGIAQKAPQVKPAPPGFRPAETRPVRLPAMTLRGIGRMNSMDQPTALIEIGQFGLFVVTENDTISLQGLNGDNVMRIVEISDISVTVEAGSFGELIVVR